MRQKVTLVFLSVMIVAGMILAGCDAPMKSQDFESVMGSWDAANAERITLAGDTVANPDSTLASFDVDKNGTEDLLLGNDMGMLWAVINNSFTGISTTDDKIMTFWGGPRSPLCADELVDVGDNSAPDMADYDNDGELEALVGNAEGMIYYVEVISYEDMKTNLFPAVEEGRTIMVPGGYAVPTSGDVVGDELIDMVVGAGDGRIHVYENVGKPDTPVPAYWGELSIDVGNRAAPVLQNLDDDPELEMVIGNAAGEIFACDGIDSMCFNLGKFVESNANPTVADFNHDGLWDLVIASGNGKGWFVPGVSSE